MELIGIEIYVKGVNIAGVDIDVRTAVDLEREVAITNIKTVSNKRGNTLKYIVQSTPQKLAENPIQVELMKSSPEVNMMLIHTCIQQVINKEDLKTLANSPEAPQVLGFSFSSMNANPGNNHCPSYGRVHWRSC